MTAIEIPVEYIISIKKQVLADLNNEFRDNQKLAVDQHMKDMAESQTQLLTAIKTTFDNQQVNTQTKHDELEKQFLHL